MRHLSRWYLLIAAGLTVLGFATATSAVYGSAVTALAAFTALGAILIGLRTRGPQRPRAWRLLAAALMFWGIAASIFTFAAARATPLNSLLAELIYVPGLVAITLMTIELTRRMGRLRIAGLEAAIGAFALGSLIWALVLAPRFEQSAGAVSVPTIVYPLCDVVLLMLLLRVVFSPLLGLHAVRWLASASLLLVTADLLYYSPLGNKTVLATRIINALYVAAYTSFGAAALHRSMRRLPARRPFADDVASRRLVATLGCALLTTPLSLLVLLEVDRAPDTAPVLVIGTLTVLLVLARLWALMHHLESLRRRAEASEQRFRMVFDSAGHGMSIGANGMMTETNAALHRMLGYTNAELAEKHFSETTHPDDLTLAEVASEEVMSGKRPSHTFEKRLLRRDGSSFWVSVTLTRAGDGSFGISLIDDLTGRKELEDELRQAHKMEAIGKLAGGIAHDFNNVMTAVSGCAELLLNEIDKNDPRRERVEVIHESAARATKLTRQLLAFSRRQVLHLEPVDLSKVAAGLEGMLERLLPPNISASYDLAPNAIAQVDLPQLEQVLLNLALNARDAMPTGGNIAVSVRTAGANAELVVADDGVGMSEETRSRIFEPFFTTKSAGTGLGLSTVDGIVAQSGGTISVESEPGRGSTFTIRLPRVYEAPATEPPTPAQPAAAAVPGRILLADDEDLVRHVTAELMRRGGYDVVCAASGEEALELLDDRFDALVTDVAMTGMNGQDLARHVRDRFPSMPVLFISGYPAEVLTGQHMVDAGEEVLTKPFTPVELTARLELVRGRAADTPAAA